MKPCPVDIEEPPLRYLEVNTDVEVNFTAARRVKIVEEDLELRQGSSAVVLHPTTESRVGEYRGHTTEQEWTRVSTLDIL